MPDTKNKRGALIIMPAVILVVFFLDQLTKLLILDWLQSNVTVSVIDGFFNLTLAYNRGAAFGVFSGLSDGWREAVITISTIFALVILIFFFIKEYKEDRVAQVAVSMVFGGALGNIWDRVRLGHVVDFLDFYIGNYHWPAFNVADSSICVGVFILLFRPRRKSS